VDRDSQGYGRMDKLNFGTLKFFISVISAKKAKVPKLKRSDHVCFCMISVCLCE